MKNHPRPQITTTQVGELLIDAIPILQTNYLWMIRHLRHDGAYILDPGESAPVLQYLKHLQANLQGILMTHSHWDHIDGLNDMLADTPKIDVHGPRCSAIPQVTKFYKDNDKLLLWNDIEITVFETPGHLPEHLSFYSELSDISLLFCADTLFSSGCGRIFNGTPKQLKASLDRFKKLPPKTLVFCSHEYTEANLGFAKAVEPGNTKLEKRLTSVMERLSKGLPSIPTTIDIELAHNPFLRCDQPEIANSVRAFAHGKGELIPQELSELDVFTWLRRWKDEY